MKHLAFIDTIRALAVVTVVLYHLCKPLVPNGFLGVDVFFVISGFIVSYAVSNRNYSSFVGFLSDFYARRFLRILPALLICLLVTAILTAIFVPEAWLSSSIDRTGFFAIFGLSNIYLSQGTDYFSPVTDFNPFTHTWSLGVEEQFYFIFPILFSFWALKYGSKYLSVALYALALISSLIFYIVIYNSRPLTAFYMVHARFWELAAGVLCFQTAQILKSRPIFIPFSIDRIKTIVSSIALVVLTASFYVEIDPTYGWMNNLIAVSATVLLILSMYRVNLSKTYYLYSLEARPIRFFGRISYSLYLWHWPVFVLARWTFGLETPPQQIFALLIALAASLLSYYFIEEPLRNAKSIHTAPRYVIISTGLIAILGTYLISDALRLNKPAISASVVEMNRSDWIPAPDLSTYKDTSECSVAAKELDYGIAFERTNCGAGTVKNKVFALGDSHTGAFIPLLKRFTLQTGIQSIVIATAGCPALSLEWPRDNAASCIDAVQNGFNSVYRMARSGDVVFLTSLRLPRLAEQFYRFSDEAVSEQIFSDRAIADRNRSIDQAISLLSPLSEMGVHIVFEEPKPIFRSPPFRCSDWFNQRNPSCNDGLSIERQVIEHMRTPIIDAMRKVQERIPLVKLWDPLPILCPGDVCETTHNGRPLYFDADHVSDYASFLLRDSFVNFIITTLDEADLLTAKEANSFN